MKALLLLSTLCATLALAQTPAIAPNGVLNAASFVRGQAVAGGSLVSIFGSELAAGLTQNDTTPLSTTLSNVSVTFNNIPAGLYFVSPGQINAQIPWNVLPEGTTTGDVTMTVKRGEAVSSQTVRVVPVAPGIFYLSDLGGWAIAINADGTLAIPAGTVPGLTSHAAAAGEAIVIYSTGLGAVDRPIANGANSLDELRRVREVPTVLVGGRSAQVLFAGLTPQFPGVNQVNFLVPAGLTPGAVTLQLQSGGITTPEVVKMGIR
jgi:uncharacterized protein (TIGR03437 family)